VLLWREHDTTFEDAASRCCRVRTEKSGLTGKFFTSFQGLKFPDSGVVWGGVVWLPEYM